MKEYANNIVLEAIGRIFYLVPSRPYRIQIEVTNRCNLTCPMCPRSELKIAYEDMPVERFKKIIDKIYRPSLVILTGWGEPLMHPHIFEMIRYAKDRSHETSLTTNGFFIKGNEDNIMDSKLDRLVVSIEDNNQENIDVHAHPFNQDVLEGLENIARLKNRRGRPIIRLHITLHENNKKRLLEVIKYGAKIGVDSVNLIRLYTLKKQSLKRPPLKKELEVIKDAERLGRKLGIRVDSNFTRFEGIRRFFYKMICPYLYRMYKFCPKTYDQAYITLDGDITPCCLLLENVMGNILSKELYAIWNSKEFKVFRKKQLNYCHKCDTLKLHHLFR